MEVFGAGLSSRAKRIYLKTHLKWKNHEVYLQHQPILEWKPTLFLREKVTVE